MKTKVDSLDIKVLLTTGHIDHLEILNTIRMWIDNADYSWECELEYLMTEHYKHKEYKKRYEKVEKEYCQIQPYFIKLRKTVDGLLSQYQIENGGIPSEQLETIESLDIFNVLKDICNHKEIEKLMLWTLEALDGHLKEREWATKKDNWEKSYSSLVILKENLTKIQEKNLADYLKFKMDTLKSRWNRVDKLTKMTEVNTEDVIVTNVVYAE